MISVYDEFLFYKTPLPLMLLGIQAGRGMAVARLPRGLDRRQAA